MVNQSFPETTALSEVRTARHASLQQLPKMSSELRKNVAHARLVEAMINSDENEPKKPHASNKKALYKFDKKAI